MGVVEAAAKLFDILGLQDTTFTRHLLPGHTRSEIQALVSLLGVVLPEEALQFYENYRLPKGYHFIPKNPQGEGQPTFFGIYWMLGLEDAVEQYRVIEFSQDFNAENEFFVGENEGSSGWFPFLEEDAYFYLLDTFHASNGLCPVISVPEAGGPEPEFVSMSAMFETMFDWVTEGVLAVKDGHLLGDYSGDPLRVGQIGVRHNPGIVTWEQMASGRS